MTAMTPIPTTGKGEPKAEERARTRSARAVRRRSGSTGGAATTRAARAGPTVATARRRAEPTGRDARRIRRRSAAIAAAAVTARKNPRLRRKRTSRTGRRGRRSARSGAGARRRVRREYGKESVPAERETAMTPETATIKARHRWRLLLLLEKWTLLSQTAAVAGVTAAAAVAAAAVEAAAITMPAREEGGIALPIRCRWRWCFEGWLLESAR